MESLYIDGTVRAIYFSNPANFYKVMLVQVDETTLPYDEKEVVIVGHFGQIQEGDAYVFYGTLIEHPKYGVQLKCTRYETKQPASEAALINYLSSSKFKGIGQVTAERIIDTLGTNCLDAILDNSDVLLTVPGMNQKKAKMVADVIYEEQGMQRVILMLNKYGIGNQLAYRIYTHYDEETLHVIQTNPYQLATDIQGVGFQKADYIASELNVPEDSPCRIQAALHFVLYELCLSGGHTYIKQDHLLTDTIKMLEGSRAFIIEYHIVEQYLSDMVDQQQLIMDDDKIYLPSLFSAEWGIVTSIERLQNHTPPPFSSDTLTQHLQTIEETFGIQYGPSQQTAIQTAMNAPIYILTGGPGTGKTTVLRAIVHLFSELHELSLDVDDYHDEPFPIVMAAPTGRAAKQMTETTGLKASTIHRLLGLSVDNQEREEAYSPADIQGKLLIIDEMSMVDTWLTNQLLKAVPSDMQVILVGDKDQLPSVGPGQVLRDLLESGRVETTELIDIYRQDDGSSIIPLAHSIKQNQLPANFTQPQKDRTFITCTAVGVSQVVEQVVRRAVKKGYTIDDIQVLAPMYRGAAGIDQLNILLQNILNPNHNGAKKEVRFMDRQYRIGDKVLQLVNEAERNVFNGDVGYITGIIPKSESTCNADELVIDFDGNEIAYPRNEWNKITLAYCCSIHKAQGSEYKMVILPMVNQFFRMLQKDLLYTAVTRASQFLIMCGELNAYKQCMRSDERLRQTTLAACLAQECSHTILDDATLDNVVSRQPSSLVNSSCDNQQIIGTQEGVKQLTEQLITQQLIDPMIGMDGLKPSDL